MPKQIKQLNTRPPVVVVLGHVDHGKSSLIEKIKDIKITNKEAGSITQHIAAYQVEHQNKQITFIDTPGHHTFETMRAHGAKIADIAVLVIAADEGVKPQTTEAIKHCQDAEIPIIIAINKIDKPLADSQKIKGQLEKQGIVVEEKGGQIVCCEISAQTGQGIDKLLEMILLVAEMEEIKGNPDAPAQGTIIESHLDSQSGPTATLLLYNGSLEIGDEINIEGLEGKVKSISDFQGNKIEKAMPSMPVVITGFKKLPAIDVPIFEIKNDSLNVIIKADAKGTLESIIFSIKDKEKLNILKSDVGDVNENDIKQAIQAKALVFGFNVKFPGPIKQLAEREKISVKIYKIIYELLEQIEKEVSKAGTPKQQRIDLGKLEVLAIFRTEKDQMIIGGRVIEGKIIKNANLDIIRNGEKIGSGKSSGLQENKKDVNEVKQGKECGIKFKGEAKIQQGDILEAFNVQTN